MLYVFALVQTFCITEEGLGALKLEKVVERRIVVCCMYVHYVLCTHYTYILVQSMYSVHTYVSGSLLRK